MIPDTNDNFILIVINQKDSNDQSNLNLMGFTKCLE